MPHNGPQKIQSAHPTLEAESADLTTEDFAAGLRARPEGGSLLSRVRDTLASALSVLGLSSLVAGAASDLEAAPSRVSLEQLRLSGWSNPGIFEIKDGGVWSLRAMDDSTFIDIDLPLRTAATDSMIQFFEERDWAVFAPVFFGNVPFPLQPFSCDIGIVQSANPQVDMTGNYLIKDVRANGDLDSSQSEFLSLAGYTYRPYAGESSPYDWACNLTNYMCPDSNCTMDTFVRDAALGRPECFESIGAFPNPYNPLVTLGFELGAARSVDVTVFNLQGQQISRTEMGLLPAGAHRLPLDTRDSPSGIQFARVVARGGTKEESVTLKLIKAK